MVSKWLSISFLPMLDFQPFAQHFYLHHSGTQQRCFVSVCLTLRCWNSQKQISNVGTQWFPVTKHFIHQYFYSCTLPPWLCCNCFFNCDCFFVFFCQGFVHCLTVSYCIFWWSEQQKIHLKVLCVVLSYWRRCSTVDDFVLSPRLSHFCFLISRLVAEYSEATEAVKELSDCML